MLISRYFAEHLNRCNLIYIKINLLQLSIIIVNYNVKYFLEQCIYSVEIATFNIAAQIIVIDNNSSDGSKEFFCNKFPNVQFIWNKKNVGFSKANNLGLAEASGKYILFLNPDTLVAEDCFSKCINFYETHQHIGALGIRMIDGSGQFLKESKRGFPSLFPSIFKLFGLSALFPKSKIFARYYLGNLSEYENHEVDVLSGAFMLIEKKVLDKIGGFDEDFFMYGEDIDLSYRIQNAGYKNYYFSESTIIHFKGESTKKGSLKYVQLFYGAMNLFLQKHNTSTKSNLYSFFIKIAIGLKIADNNLKKAFSFFITKNKNLGQRSIPTLVVADEQDYLLINDSLKNDVIKLHILGRIDGEKKQQPSIIGHIANLPKILLAHQIERIIFCINTYSIKEIITIIQNLQPAVNFSFHYKGSKSIVGSNNKNEGGDCIELLPASVINK